MEIAICNKNFCPTTLKEVIHSDRMDSLAFTSKSSLQMRENPASSYESNSSCSTQSSSSSSDCCDSICRGILQRTWKNSYSHFVFSFNNQTEEYAAHLCMVDDDNLDCAYFFHSRKDGEVDDGEAALVGKMRASTSFYLSPKNSRTKETKFLMFGFGENSPMEIHNINSSRIGSMRKTGFWKKMDDVFRKDQSSRQRFFQNSLAVAEAHPDCELSAIVVRDYILEDQPTNLEGWGLKFLRNLEIRSKIDSDADGSTGIAVGDQIADDPFSKQGGWGLTFLDKIETSLQSKFQARRRSYRTMNVIIPAGVHGGNESGNSGHSSLIERWRSNGGCDCGGWDLGCPITVLKTKDLNGEFNPFALHLQGCAQDPSSTLRMVEVGDGSYSVFSRSNLISPLQCFSVAIAAILSNKPRPDPSHPL